MNATAKFNDGTGTGWYGMDSRVMRAERASKMCALSNLSETQLNETKEQQAHINHIQHENPNDWNFSGIEISLFHWKSKIAIINR